MPPSRTCVDGLCGTDDVHHPVHQVVAVLFMCVPFFSVCAGPILGALGFLTRLKTLFLSHNQLTGEPVALFVSSVCPPSRHQEHTMAICCTGV